MPPVPPDRTDLLDGRAFSPFSLPILDLTLDRGENPAAPLRSFSFTFCLNPSMSRRNHSDAPVCSAARSAPYKLRKRFGDTSRAAR